ncbi:MAG TPA: type II and III secretion system family protein [Micavibrio sp.]|nr:type II and III secretion system family protein [Micavibrio sp.]
MVRSVFGKAMNIVAVSALLMTTACAMADVPDARNANIPSPTMAEKRRTAVNERPDSVMYLPLGEDVLVPEVSSGDEFPHEMVGPFELRGETLAGALQLILADYDISLAFETQEGLTRRITVANLRGDLGKVVHQVCSLANLYCSYEDGSITVKDTQTFTVTLPPLGTQDESDFLDDVAEGLGAILNNGSTTGSSTISTPIVDPTTRTLVYSATQRTADIATRYFQRLRANTAMIVFETYIWEVSLDSGNSLGIDWAQLAEFGKFGTGIAIKGDVGADFLNPISIGLPTTSGQFDGSTTDLLKFLSQYGAVKTISQPQITVLSGSNAELRVADTQNYVSQIATTLSEGQATTSVNTDSVDTGFTLTIGSSWDKSTVYANVEIELTDVKKIDNFAFSDTPDPDDPDAQGTQTRIQLPQTSERQLTTQIRVRPGDSVLIAGLVRENDNFNERGPGFMEPLIPDSRTTQSNNLELVVLLRPRVVVYTAANDKRYIDYAMKKHKAPGAPAADISKDVPDGENVYKTAPVVDPVQEEIPSGMPAPLTALPSASPIATSEPRPAPVAPPSVITAAPLSPPSPAPAPAPVVPSWDKAPDASSSVEITPVDNSARFRRSAGFSSSPTAPAASVRPGLYIPPAAAPAPAPEAYVPAMPAPAPVAPAPAADASPYQTYDYYKPSY